MILLTLFPLAISPERQILEQVGLGALWIMSLLAMLSAAEQTIAPDLEQGVTDHMVCGSVPLWWQVIAKVLMHLCRGEEGLARCGGLQSRIVL